MVLPQRIPADESFRFVPPLLAAAAAAYERARVVESAQLALMGRQKLDEEWSGDARATVLLARQRIYETQQSRAELRDQVRRFITAVRDAGASAPAAVEHSRSMIRLLESTGVITPDGGRFEAEVLAWASEDCEARETPGS